MLALFLNLLMLNRDGLFNLVYLVNLAYVYRFLFNLSILHDLIIDFTLFLLYSSIIDIGMVLMMVSWRLINSFRVILWPLDARRCLILLISNFRCWLYSL